MKPNQAVLAVGLVLLIASTTLFGQTPEAKKTDEFTNPNWEDAMAHLDNFVLTLQNDPSTTGLIFIYGGQNRRRHEPDAWSKCTMDYLVKRRSIDPTRLAYVLGGYRERLTIELWLAPDKNHMPKAESTIKPPKVKFKGRNITRWRALCSL